ncbi:MAG: hypothetical protein JWN71_3208 [Xanthobacteraceae bacterium]|nr:hypothetical protein [Xanthobacteraceae bacterium]
MKYTMGFDGTDSLSPTSEIRERLRDLEALPDSEKEGFAQIEIDYLKGVLKYRVERGSPEDVWMLPPS